MSAYPPPKEDLAVFNSANFEYVDDSALTYDTAKKYFLTYPTAQGTQNFLDANVANRLLVDGEIQFSDGTIQTTAALGNSSIIPTLYAYSSSIIDIAAPIIYLNFIGSNWDINDFFTIQADIQVRYNDNTYTSYNGFIDIYPFRVPTNVSLKANVNNDINGVSTFDYTNPTYAPSGRYYYSHSYSLQGANDKIYFHSNNKSQIGFYITNVDSPQRARVSIALKVINKGSNSSSITITGINSYDNYESVNF